MISFINDIDVTGTVGLMRALESVRSSRPIPQSVRARRIYRRELYEAGPLINLAYKPIANGDVFQKIGGTKCFVLAAQPCNLTVRTTGKRTPDISHVALVPIKRRPSDHIADSRKHFLLPSFWPIVEGDGENEDAFVGLSEAEYVAIEVLDYCAFDSSGESVAPVFGTNDEGIVELVPSWQTRLERLNTSASKLRQRFTSSNDDNILRVRSHFGVREKGIIAPVCLSTASKFGFGIARVRRIRPDWAIGILNALSDYWTRDAFDGPLVPNRDI